ELGMTGETVRLWLKPADLDEGKRSDGLSRDEQEELRRLRRANRLVREERAILNKAAAHLPRRRAVRSGERLPIHRAREGHARGGDPVPRAGCLPQWLVGLAPVRPIRAGERMSAYRSASGRSIRPAAARTGPRASMRRWRAGAPAVDANAS